MAENSNFENSQVFTGTTGYGDLPANDTTETLATQGNVKNTLQVFWNKLRKSLVKVITRGTTTNSVGSDWCPIYVDKDGVVNECNAKMLTVGIEGNGSVSANAVRDITTPHTGTTAYLHISHNGSNNSNYAFQINGKGVKYISGVEVKAEDITADDNLVLTYAKDSDSAGFWILLNKVNTASYSGGIQTTQPASLSDAKNGLMSAMDKAKLDSMDWGANKSSYSLVPATTTALGGVCLGESKKDKDITGLQGTGNINKYYPVTADTDNKLVVNVGWTDNDTHYVGNLIVSNDTTSTSIAATSGNDNTYIGYVENGLRRGTNAKIKGTGGATVSSANGIITINAEQYIVQKPQLILAGGITKRTDGNFGGSITFRDSGGTGVKVKVLYNGKPVGQESATLSLPNLQIPALTANGTGIYYIPFYPVGRNDILPGLVRLTITCTVTTSGNNTSYAYEVDNLSVI